MRIANSFAASFLRNDLKMMEKEHTWHVAEIENHMRIGIYFEFHDETEAKYKL